MRPGNNIRSEIRAGVKQAHLKALKTDTYLKAIEREIFSLIVEYSSFDFIKAREISRGFDRIVRISKENDYPTKRFLTLLAQFVEGVARDFQKQLFMERKYGDIWK